MPKTNKTNKKTNYKVMENGGFFNDAGSFLKNNLMGSADMGLSMLGMNNIIPDEAYKGYGANYAKGMANIGGNVGKAALPMLATAAFGPMGGTAVKAGQSVLGNVDNRVTSNRAANDPANFNPLIDYNNQNIQMPYGGQAGPNAELEKQENTLNPDGSTSQFNGPGHSEGGIPTKLDPGTLVFSDRLKMNGKTFADLNKRYSTKKEEKILSDPKANNTAKLTAQIMMQAKNKQSVSLFEQQEALKQEKLQKYAGRIGMKMPNGGMVPKYPYGDIIPPDSNPLSSMPDIDPQMIFGQKDASRDINSYFSGAGKIEDVNMGNPQMKFNNVDAYRDAQFTNNTGNNFQWQNAAVGAGSLLAANVGNFYDLKNAKNVPVEKYERYTPTTLDPSADLRYNRMLNRQAVDKVKNASGGDASTYIQNNKDLALGTQMNNARLNMMYNNANAQIKNQAGMYNNQLSQQEVIANAQNLARSQDLKSNAYRGIGGSTAQGMQGYNRDLNMATRDKQFLQLVQARYPELDQNAALKKFFEDNK